MARARPLEVPSRPPLESVDGRLRITGRWNKKLRTLKPLIIYQSEFHENCNWLRNTTTANRICIDRNKLIQIVKLHIISSAFYEHSIFFSLVFVSVFNFISLTSKFHVIMLCSRLPLIHRYVYCVC